MDRVTWRQIAVPCCYLVLVGLMAIFVHSGLQGPHGLAAYHEAKREEARLTAELASLKAERAALANKVDRISEGFLDLDLLDERARAVLGLVHEDELVVR